MEGGGGGGGMWIVLFFEVTPFNYSAILSLIVVKLQKQSNKTMAEMDAIHDRLNGVVT